MLIHGHNFSYLSYFIKSISHSWSQYFSRPSTRSLLRRTTQLSSPSPSRWLDSCSARRATRDHLEIFFGITFWPSCEDKVDGTRSASSQWWFPLPAFGQKRSCKSMVFYETMGVVVGEDLRGCGPGKRAYLCNFLTTSPPLWNHI